MKLPCNVILDLIPLVKDKVASEESKNTVKDHIEGCPSCKNEFEEFECISLGDQSIKDEKVLSNIKRSIFISQIVVLIIGAIIGIGLTNTMGMFYNFIIMPGLGGLAFITLRRYGIVLIGVFILTYIWQVVSLIIETRAFNWWILQAGVIHSLIYTGLVLLGIIIARLINYALGREEVGNEK